MFAVQADGAEVLTIEGLAKDGKLHQAPAGATKGGNPKGGNHALRLRESC
jgi:aerobic-type carbon monoxide dehydrogenase small subunit (CoxS/CutS family)